MLSLVPVVILVLYLVRTVRNLFYHLAWWEIKEYRLDRMWVHIRDTYQGKMWLFGYFSVIKWVLLVLYFIPVSFIPRIYLNQAIILIFTGEGLFNLYELASGWKMPPFRIRVGAVGIVAILVLAALISLPTPIVLRLLIVDKSIGLIVAGLIFLSNIIFSLHKENTLKKARLKISQYKDLQVVGITGSYGKTSTKEFIAQILESKHRIVKTLASQNSDIGIAERILNSDLTDVEIFVCEMAAYHPGEIASSCSLFGEKIKVGVLTGINEQHQSLFGSIEATEKSKYELIQAVHDKGIAIFNGENKCSHEMSKWSHPQKLSCIVVNKSHIKELPAQVHGSHFKENLALAAAAAQSFGMSNKDIKEAIKTIALPKRTMDTVKEGGVTIVNDTFNANPDAVYAALRHMSRIQGKKVLVLQPLIELGKYADEVHVKIGEMAGEICDQIVLTNKNFNEPFMRGLRQVPGGLRKLRFGQAPSHIREGVMLFEGKEAEKYLKHFEYIV